MSIDDAEQSAMQVARLWLIARIGHDRHLTETLTSTRACYQWLLAMVALCFLNDSPEDRTSEQLRRGGWMRSRANSVDEWSQ
jgi:hypothetical protein